MSSYSDLEAQIKQLQSENKAMKEKQPEITFKVSPKGCVSVYGLQRFPVSLYPEQWKILIQHIEELDQFIDTATYPSPTK